MGSSLFARVAAVLFVAGLAATTEGCDPSQIDQCSSNMQDPGTDLDAICAATEKMKQCILKALEGCPPDVVAKSTKALEQSSAPCNPDSGCSMQKMRKCIEGLPMDAPPKPDSVDLNTMCPKISKAKMCLEKIVNSCDNPDIKSSIQQTISGMQQYEGMCNNHSDSETYESGSSGNSDNSDVKVTVDESAKEEVEVAIAEAEAEAEKEGEDDEANVAVQKGKKQGNNNNNNNGGGSSGSGNGDNGSPSIRASVFALSSLLALPLFVQALIRM